MTHSRGPAPGRPGEFMKFAKVYLAIMVALGLIVGVLSQVFGSRMPF